VARRRLDAGRHDDQVDLFEHGIDIGAQFSDLTDINKVSRNVNYERERCNTYQVGSNVKRRREVVCDVFGRDDLELEHRFEL
jgi:hypothetical protein